MYIMNVCVYVYIYIYILLHDQTTILRLFDRFETGFQGLVSKGDPTAVRLAVAQLPLCWLLTPSAVASAAAAARWSHMRYESCPHESLIEHMKW